MKLKKNDTFKTVLFTIKQILMYEKALIPIMIIHIILNVLKIFVLPLFVKLVIEQNSIEELFKTVVAFVFVAGGIYVGIGLIESQKRWRIQCCSLYCQKELMNVGISMNYELTEDSKILDHYQKARMAVKNGDRGIEGMIYSMENVLILLFQAIVSSIVLSGLSPILVVVMFLITPIQFIPTDRTKKKDKKEVWDELAPYWRKNFELNRMTQDFEFAKDVRLYNMADWLHKKHLDLNGEMQEKIIHCQKLWTKCHILIRCFDFVQSIILYSWLVYNYLYRGLSIADFILYISIVQSFTGAVGGFLWAFATLRGQAEEVKDYQEFLEKYDVRSKILAYPINDMSVIPSLDEGKFEFRFEHVYFRYKGQEKYALKDINLTIESGKRLAVVGLNGAGKTTLIKLLCRLYEPTEGQIYLNGVDISLIDKSIYFDMIAPVFQDAQMFAFTVEENVSMRSEKNTDDIIVKQCLKDAKLEKILGYSKGIHTPMLKILASDGIDLSGGERQKLVLARALYKRTKVCILDEPTAALDPIAEYTLYKDFDDLIGEKTAVFVSHRLSSTRFCDSVAVFDSGKMVEYGTHEQLLSAKGHYANLYETQSQYYMDNGTVYMGT